MDYIPTVESWLCPLEKDEPTDKRSADLLITVVNYMARYEPPHNKTDWRRAQRPRTLSALVAMRKTPPGHPSLLEDRVASQNLDDAVTIVSRRTDQFAVEVGGSKAYNFLRVCI